MCWIASTRSRRRQYVESARRRATHSSRTSIEGHCSRTICQYKLTLRWREFGATYHELDDATRAEVDHQSPQLARVGFAAVVGHSPGRQFRLDGHDLADLDVALSVGDLEERSFLFHRLEVFEHPIAVTVGRIVVKAVAHERLTEGLVGDVGEAQTLQGPVSAFALLVRVVT